MNEPQQNVKGVCATVCIEMGSFLFDGHFVICGPNVVFAFSDGQLLLPLLSFLTDLGIIKMKHQKGLK